MKYISKRYLQDITGGRHGRDRMVVEFTTTCWITVCHH